MADRQYVLYMHRNILNNKVYIGITKQSPPSKRWHNGEGYIKNKHFYNAIQKYGWNKGFEHLILEENLTKEEACLKEKQKISEFDSLNPEKGYNLVDGGIHLGPSHFEKMTEWANCNKKFGKENVNSCKVRCIETGDIFGSIAEAKRWCGNSPKIGECCRGIRKHAGFHPLTGEPLTWEYAKEKEQVTIVCNTKQATSKNKIGRCPKKVKCIETEEIFESEKQACLKYGAAKGTIGRACNGKRDTALGLHWIWIE